MACLISVLMMGCIAPDATATYIYAYRDMWDNEKDEKNL